MSASRTTRTPFRRWIGGAAAAAALSVVGVFAVAAPASAGTGDCPNGGTCLWKDANYVTSGIGFIYQPFANGIKDLRNYNWDFGNGNVNDNVSSAYNNGNQQTSYLFYSLNFKDQIVALRIKQGIAQLTIGNDAATSAGFQFCVNNPNSSMCV